MTFLLYIGKDKDFFAQIQQARKCPDDLCSKLPGCHNDLYQAEGA